MVTLVAQQPLATWIQMAQALKVDAFCVLHPHPFLLVDAPAPPAAPEVTVTTGKLQAVPRGATSVSDALTTVHLVVKRQAAFPGMITVGRAPNNDVVLPVPTVSTFHAWFAQDPQGRWTLHEGRATHGTWLGDRPLQGQPAALGEDALLRFGVTGARFLTARRFHALLAGV